MKNNDTNKSHATTVLVRNIDKYVPFIWINAGIKLQCVEEKLGDA
jgi:hypothetical protein